MIPDGVLGSLRYMVGGIDFGKLWINGKDKVPDWLRDLVNRPEEYTIVRMEANRDTYPFGGVDYEIIWNDNKGELEYKTKFKVIPAPEPKQSKVVPERMKRALDKIKSRKPGTNITYESSHDGKWIVVDAHGVIRRFDHMESAILMAVTYCLTCLIHGDYVWNAAEVGELHDALMEREGRKE